MIFASSKDALRRRFDGESLRLKQASGEVLTVQASTSSSRLPTSARSRRTPSWRRLSDVKRKPTIERFPLIGVCIDRLRLWVELAPADCNRLILVPDA